MIFCQRDAKVFFCFCWLLENILKIKFQLLFLTLHVHITNNFVYDSNNFSHVRHISVSIHISIDITKHSKIKLLKHKRAVKKRTKRPTIYSGSDLESRIRTQLESNHAPNGVR